MGIDHRRLHVAMVQKFLDGSNIVTAFQQMHGKIVHWARPQYREIRIFSPLKPKNPIPRSEKWGLNFGHLCSQYSDQHLAIDNQHLKTIRQLKKYLLLLLPIYWQSTNTDRIILNNHDCPSKQRPFEIRPEILHPDKKMIRVRIPQP